MGMPTEDEVFWKQRLITAMGEKIRRHTYGLASRVESHVIDAPFMSCHLCTLARCDIPQCDAVVFITAAGRNLLALTIPTRSEQVRLSALLSALEYADCPILGCEWLNIPRPYRAVVREGQEAATIWRYNQRRYQFCMPFKFVDNFLGSEIPNFYIRVDAGREHLSSHFR